MTSTGCGRPASTKYDGSARSTRTQYTRGKLTSKRCSVSWRGTLGPSMRSARGPVGGGERPCACGAFGSTRVSRENNCRQSVLDPSQCCRSLCFDSDVAAAVLADLPMDSTSIEDVLHAALLKKEAVKVASTANEMDLWLAAHITDLMLPLQLPESSILLCVFFPHWMLLWTYTLTRRMTGAFGGTLPSPMRSRYCPTQGSGEWLSSTWSRATRSANRPHARCSSTYPCEYWSPHQDPLLPMTWRSLQVHIWKICSRFAMSIISRIRKPIFVVYVVLFVAV
jgi:hypothetical protein